MPAKKVPITPQPVTPEAEISELLEVALPLKKNKKEAIKGKRRFEKALSSKIREVS